MIQQATVRRLAIVASLAMACGEPSGPDGASLLMIGFENQKGFAGIAAYSIPEVVVLNRSGAALSGIPVSFTVTLGGGSVSATTVISDLAGRASAGRWILGPNPGTNAVTAKAEGFGSLKFTAEAIAVPTGVFELAAINDHALPFRFDGDFEEILGGKLFINDDGTFAEMISWRYEGTSETVQRQTVGTIQPDSHAPIAFYISANGAQWVWARGSVNGDTLVAEVYDLGVRTFVRERTGCPADGMCPPPPESPPSNGRGEISGIVYERTADGIRPLAYARTWAYAYSGLNYFAGGATADSFGRFTISNLPFAEIKLTAGADGFDQPCARVVNLRAPFDTTSIELVSRLHPMPELATDPPVVKGVVYETTPQGRQPIPGAWVYLDQFDDALSATTTTNEKGEYAICRVPTRILSPSIVVVKDGYKDGYQDLFGLFANKEVLTLDVELTRR
jgi:hypothetical protein